MQSKKQPFHNSNTKFPNNMAKIKSDKNVRSRENPKMHSTALNNTSIFGDTSSVAADFSSMTVVGGAHYKRHHPQKSERSSLFLPDISAISAINCPFPVSEVDFTHSPDSEKAEIGEKKMILESDCTQDEIEMQYLKLLTWVLLDTENGNSISKQAVASEKEIACLMSLEEEEQNLLLEEEKLLILLRHYNRVSRYHQIMKELLENHSATVSLCEKVLESLIISLENQLDDVSLENIYIPADEPSYKKGLTIALKENFSLLNKLTFVRHMDAEVSELLTELVKLIKECADTFSPCKDHIEEVARSTIQDSSLKLTVAAFLDN